MKVKMLVSRCGPDVNDVTGDIVEVSAAEAERMIAAGQCEIVRKGKAERAVKKGKAERAVK